MRISQYMLFILSICIFDVNNKPSFADSVNEAPIIILTTTPVNISALPITDEAKKAIEAAEDVVKKNPGSKFIFSATADRRSWSLNPRTKELFINYSEIAKSSIETCQYIGNGSPCFIMSIDGNEARDATNGWPLQPDLLKIEIGAAFDGHRIPFLSMVDRSNIIGGYQTVAKPRALVVTSSGWYTYTSGSTIAEAINNSFSACFKSSPTAICILYAVNDTIVFTK